MLRTGMRRALVSAALAAPVALLSAEALASPSLTVKAGEEVFLEGTVSFHNVRVEAGGALIVRSVAGGGTGMLTLKASSVVIEAGARIDATAAGFAGTPTNGGAPICCQAAAGQAGPSAGTPGGGGGSGGKGANGCTATGNGGNGGEAYIVLSSGNPGAAGGAATLTSPGDIPTNGGRGGGAVTILAAKVQIDGDILADGAPGGVADGVGSGGGAGGFISIDASELTGAGTLSVRGGDGGQGKSGTGGGGGGGVLFLSAGTTDPDGLLLVLDRDGGSSGGCNPGSQGERDIQIDPAKTCKDLDGDGAQSTECGGTDCDDSDSSVRDGAIEVCDGRTTTATAPSTAPTSSSWTPAPKARSASPAPASTPAPAAPAAASTAPLPTTSSTKVPAPCAPQPLLRSARGAAIFGAMALGLIAAFRARKRRSGPR
ncbi:MAG: putative metal-binding motif-containing protein [Polyangiaceae bacterium]